MRDLLVVVSFFFAVPEGSSANSTTPRIDANPLRPISPKLVVAMMEAPHTFYVRSVRQQNSSRWFLAKTKLRREWLHTHTRPGGKQTSCFAAFLRAARQSNIDRAANNQQISYNFWCGFRCVCVYVFIWSKVKKLMKKKKPRLGWILLHHLMNRLPFSFGSFGTKWEPQVTFKFNCTRTFTYHTQFLLGEGPVFIAAIFCFVRKHHSSSPCPFLPGGLESRKRKSLIFRLIQVYNVCTKNKN